MEAIEINSRGIGRTFKAEKELAKYKNALRVTASGNELTRNIDSFYQPKDDWSYQFVLGEKREK